MTVLFGMSNVTCRTEGLGRSAVLCGKSNPHVAMAFYYNDWPRH